jgi:hypothetical protein
MIDSTHPSSIFTPSDHLRHRAAAGEKMRDSLFWESIMPDEELGFQAYLFVSGTGKAGFNVAVWSDDGRPPVLDLVHGSVADVVDFDAFNLEGLHVAQTVLGGETRLKYKSERIKLALTFEGRHPPFSYRQNPDGLPPWFALNRYEQTGWLAGELEFDGRRVALDRIGHRDHSWGPRDWRFPHHWKWFVAYTPSGERMINGWIWVARGAWGFAGYVVKDGALKAIAHIEQHATYDDDMSQRRFEARIVDTTGDVTELTLERFGVLKLPSDGVMIMEAACTATIDGRPGAGQYETQWSSAYLERLITDRA